MTRIYIIILLSLLGTALSQYYPPLYLPAENPIFQSFQVQFEEAALEVYHNQTFQAAVKAIGASLQERFPSPDDTAVSQYQSAVDQLGYQTAGLTAGILYTYSTGKASIFQQEVPEHYRDNTLFPGAKTGYDNPDTIYRSVWLKPNGSYLIKGQVYRETGVDFSISILNATQCPIAFTNKTSINYTSDGTFELYLAATNDRKSPNFLPITFATQQAFIRDTLGDWSSQYPHYLQVQTVKQSSASIQSIFEQILGNYRQQNLTLLLQKNKLGNLLDVLNSVSTPEQLRSIDVRVALSVLTTFQYSRQFVNLRTGQSEQTPNVLKEPYAPNVAGTLSGQKVSLGFYNITNQTALVVRASVGQAQYFTLPATSWWELTGNYFKTTNSLNNFQALPDAPGNFTLVISSTDPGVYNWIDTNRVTYGSLYIRWQQITGPGQSLDFKVVPLSELKFFLLSNPFNSSPIDESKFFVSPKQRQQQKDTRWSQVKYRQYRTGNYTNKSH